MKKIFIILMLSLSIFANNQILEFKIEKGSNISSAEFAYNIIDQYIKFKKFNGNDFKVKMIKNIQYRTYNGNKDGITYEYTFSIRYKPYNKTMFNDIVELKTILLITNYSKNKTWQIDNRDNDILEIEIYKLDVANTLK